MRTYNNVKPGSSSKAPPPTPGGKPVTAAMRKLYEANQAKDAATHRREEELLEREAARNRTREHQRQERERKQQQRENGELVVSDDDGDSRRPPVQQFWTEDQENQPPAAKRARTKTTDVEKPTEARSASQTEPFANDGFASASAREQRQRQHVPSYNQAALEKANLKAAKARFLADATRLAKGNRMRKGDYEVRAVEGMKFCRQRGCQYCRDFKRRMPLWLVSYIGYGPDGNTWEHWETLDCPELVIAAFYIRANVDPRDERACMRYWNYGLVDRVDGEEDVEPLEEEPEPEIFGNPQDYDWMRLGAPTGHVKPAAADPYDDQNIVITAVSKRGGANEPFVDKDGVELEPIVLTPQNVADLKADWALHRAAGKNRIATKLMDEHHWTPRIKPGGPLKGVKAQVSKQLTELGICV